MTAKDPQKNVPQKTTQKNPTKKSDADLPAGNANAPSQTHQVGKYKIEVIRDKCISAASCVAIAPGTFDLDEEGIAIILDQAGDDAETQLLAAQSCPTAAVVVTDTETGQQVWPAA